MCHFSLNCRRSELKNNASYKVAKKNEKEGEKEREGERRGRSSKERVELAADSFPRKTCFGAVNRREKTRRRGRE